MVCLLNGLDDRVSTTFDDKRTGLATPELGSHVTLTHGNVRAQRQQHVELVKYMVWEVRLRLRLGY